MTTNAALWMCLGLLALVFGYSGLALADDRRRELRRHDVTA